MVGMAYFCLTVVHDAFAPEKANSRKLAAKSLGIEFAVLDTLGQLTSSMGDDRTRRKRHGGQRREHTPAERQWIEEVVRRLIRRMAEYANDPAATFSPMTLGEPPKL